MFNFLKRENPSNTDSDFSIKIKVLADKISDLKQYEKENFDFLTTHSASDEAGLIGGPIESRDRLSYESLECLFEIMNIASSHLDQWHVDSSAPSTIRSIVFPIGKHKVSIDIHKNSDMCIIAINGLFAISYIFTHKEGLYFIEKKSEELLFGSADSEKLDQLGQDACHVLNEVLKRDTLQE